VPPKKRKQIKKVKKQNKKKVVKQTKTLEKVKIQTQEIKARENIYSDLKGNMLIPSLPNIVKKTRTIPQRKEQERILREYHKKGLIPFFYPKNNRDMVDPKLFAKVKEVDYLAEKSELLKDISFARTSAELESRLKTVRKQQSKWKAKSKKWKTGKKEPKSLKQVREETDIYLTSTGQNIQTQAFETEEGIGFDWVGLYYQRLASKSNPIPTIVKVRKEIRADNDDAGHFIAYVNNLYAYGDPLQQNLRVVGEKNLIVPDEFRVMRFLAKSILNTFAVKRNKGIEKAITQDMGTNALKYRKTEGGLDNLVISDQIIEIVKTAQNKQIIASVQTPDRKPIDFEISFEEWNERKPTLKFVETDKDYHPLDSDTLLKVIVRKYGIDSISGQRLLESLHNQEWITYPRIDVQKAEDEPIKIMTPEKRAEIKKIIAGKRSKEKLTVQEYEILKIIYESERFSANKENFVKNGYWELKSGDLRLKRDDTILASESQKYSPRLFDIVIHKRTVNEEDMLKFLIDENIGTPATRTAQLERLRNSGVLAVKEGNYVIDRRGYYMIAGHQVYVNNKLGLVKELLNKANKVEDNDFESLNKLVNQFEFIDKLKLIRETKNNAKKLIGAEHDLTYLESF
jgi:hypothetical protein